MIGFNSAVKGLLSSKKSLYVVNHNVSNANTPGYSRQEASQRASRGHFIAGTGILGSGSEVYDISRSRDSYIDYKYWNENAHKGQWDIKREGLDELEKLFGEPSDSSFRKYLDEFYQALDNMSKNPADMSFREPVKEAGLAFTEHLNETAKRLENIRGEQEFTMETMERRINSLGDQIASLNKQIYSRELDGSKANDLRDRRELLVDQLSEIANTRVDESPQGKYRVSLGGVSLVDHVDSYKVSLGKNDKTVLNWSNGGQVSLSSGQLKGLLDLYNGDGDDSSYRGIPYYQDRLNEFAKEFADRFNGQHRKGHTLGGEEKREVDFFSDGKGGKDITASNITLHEYILGDLANIAAGGKSGSAEDNGNLLKLIALRDKEAPDDFVKSILSNLAVDSLQGQRMSKSQDIILQNLGSKRDSVQGVSHDEEMADMVRFQHSYVASAKMISTMDAIMDLTVNRLGLVGR